MHDRTQSVYDNLPTPNPLDAALMFGTGDGTEKTLSMGRIEEYLRKILDGKFEYRHEKLSRRRSDYLSGKYEGETAYILSCGPSMDQVWSDDMRQHLSDKLVIAVKQTHHLAPEIIDFHLYNEIRMEEYDYPKDTIRISVSNFLPDHPSHIHYPIRNYEYSDALFVTDEYEKWSLEQRYERPWGVGIMFEIGLELPIYFECDKLLIMGFDMNSEGKYHYYDSSSEEDHSSYGVPEKEFYYSQRSIPHYLDYARSKGMEVRLHSPLSALPIPQLDEEELYEWD